MKKIIILVWISFLLFGGVSSINAAKCEYDGKKEIFGMLKWCAPERTIQEKWKYRIGVEVKTRIAKLTRDVMKVWALLAVGGIVFAGILMITSVGKDEQMTTAKNALIWCAIGFIAMVSAYPMVNITVNFIYELGDRTLGIEPPPPPADATETDWNNWNEGALESEV